MIYYLGLYFQPIFLQYFKNFLEPPLGGLERPPSPLLTKISRAAHAQILASLRIYPRSQSLLLKINLGSAHVFLSKRDTGDRDSIPAHDDALGK